MRMRAMGVRALAAWTQKNLLDLAKALTNSGRFCTLGIHLRR
jgi:hypothetical protein